MLSKSSTYRIVKTHKNFLYIFHYSYIHTYIPKVYTILLSRDLKIQIVVLHPPSTIHHTTPKPRRAPGTPPLTLQHSPFFFLSYFLNRTPRTVKKKVALFSHKKQGTKFPRDRFDYCYEICRTKKLDTIQNQPPKHEIFSNFMKVIPLQRNFRKPQIIKKSL